MAALTALWTVGVTAALAVHGLVDRTAGWGVTAMTLASIGSCAAAATLWFGRLPTGWFFVGPFSFRPAADRPLGGHLRRSMGGLWSCVTMALRGRGTPLPAETARELVVAGPYRWVRNPMALAGAAQTAGVGLWTGSWVVIALAAAGGVVWNALIRPVEEADLAARFGPAYDSYRREVRCWIPVRRPSAPAAYRS